MLSKYYENVNIFIPSVSTVSTRNSQALMSVFGGFARKQNSLGPVKINCWFTFIKRHIIITYPRLKIWRES